MTNIRKHLLTLYTRTPLHVGSGTSAEVVDLSIIRERITGFPIIPGSSLKGVLLQHARETFENGKHARSNSIPAEAKILFGTADSEGESDNKKQESNAGCVQIMEAKLLAFPVRSVAGTFAWLTCPTALERFQRDTGRKFDFPRPPVDHAVVPSGTKLSIPKQPLVVLEEFALATLPGESTKAGIVATELKKVCADPLWSDTIGQRLAVVNDENFQHFVTTCTEVVAHIVINPETRTNDNLWNQENVPCETLFYSVLMVLPPRRKDVAPDFDANQKLSDLLPMQNPPILQIGGNETTGHGLCETKREELT
jgi:CRISPR-associated protein Cmr4